MAGSLSSLDGTLSTALFVKGLAKGATERHLHAIFSQFGFVDESQVGFFRITALTEPGGYTVQHVVGSDLVLSSC